MTLWGVLAAPKRNTVNEIKWHLGLRIYTEESGLGRSFGTSIRPRVAWGCHPHAARWPGPHLRPGLARLRPVGHTERQGPAGVPRTARHRVSQSSQDKARPPEPPHSAKSRLGQRTGKPDVRQAHPVTQITSSVEPWSRCSRKAAPGAHWWSDTGATAAF